MEQRTWNLSFSFIAESAGWFSFPQEKVLHNIMSIFTFMGASVMRQDDSYSFQVIRRTVETVIPALVQVSRTHKTTRTTRNRLTRDNSALWLPRACWSSHFCDKIACKCDFPEPSSIWLARACRVASQSVSYDFMSHMNYPNATSSPVRENCVNATVCVLSRGSSFNQSINPLFKCQWV